MSQDKLNILQEKSEIVKLDRGIYTRPDVWEDEMYILQAKYKRSIFSHETALYIHELADRAPILGSPELKLIKRLEVINLLLAFF